MRTAIDTALVTGASGFLGGTLVRRLAKDGVRVRALVRSAEKGAALRGVPDTEIVIGDVNQIATLKPALTGCDVVFHVAAAFGDWDTQRTVNVEGTRNIAQAAADAEVSRLVHVSTIAVNGYDVRADMTEDQPMTPSRYDAYSATKAEGENVLREVAAERGLIYSIIRPGMIYGPGSSLWTETMFRLARMKPTPFLGNGSGSAHPVFVDDVVDMMVVLATHPNAANEVFHCSPDPAPTFREFLGAYQQLAGHHWWLGIPPALVMPLLRLAELVAPSGSQAKEAHRSARMLQRHITYRMNKARERLAWEPRVQLDKGIARCAPWLRERGLLA